MFVKKTIYSVLVFLLSLFFLGCKKAPNYPKEPSIQFDKLNVKSVTYYDEYNLKNEVDSLSITIKFKDGDGDLGNDPVKGVDFFVNIYKKINGAYNRVDFFDTLDTGLNYQGSLPLLSPYDLTGPIDGTITNILPELPAPVPGQQFNVNFPFTKNDTVKFRVRIQDRAGNYSNWVETTEYIVWQKF